MLDQTFVMAAAGILTVVDFLVPYKGDLFSHLCPGLNASIF